MTSQQPYLNGLRILNTRPKDQAQALSRAIQEAGGFSIELPMLSIQPTPTDWLEQLPALNSVNQAIFVSRNAVDYFFKTKLIWPASIEVIAIGQATSQALNAHGIRVHHTPVLADSEHLLKLDTLQAIKNHTILLIKGEGGRTLIENTLHSRNATLYPVSVYTRCLPEQNEEYLHSLWQKDAVDIILFTSQQAMQHLFVALGEKAHAWIMNKPCLVISSRLAIAAKAFGIKTIITSSYDNLLTTLEGMQL